jgi:replication factor A3
VPDESHVIARSGKLNALAPPSVIANRQQATGFTSPSSPTSPAGAVARHLDHNPNVTTRLCSCFNPYSFHRKRKPNTTMTEQLSTPRITAAYLDNFVGRVVMLVGEVTQLRGDQATLESDGTVTVLLNRVSYQQRFVSGTHWLYVSFAYHELQDAHLANGNAVQVIGKVNPDLSIKVLTSRDLGNTVDFGLYSSVVQATHKHQSIFSGN